MIVWAVETLIASTFLMLLVLVARTPVRQAFGPNVAYALWALPAARMVLPPLPDSWRGGALPVLPMPEDITVYLGEPVAMLPAAPASGIGWPVALLAVWTLGAVLFVGYHLVAHGRFCARVRRDSHNVTALASGRVRMIETDAAAGPLAFGVWRKYVAFPRDFAERYDPLERDLALAHELGHHARGDLIANWAALVMLALHWFNPVAWRAYRAFRADQEMACDALVLAGRARELRAAYGRAIVKSAHGGAVSAACHLHTINEIKGRLKMLTKHETKSRRRILAGTAAIATMLAGGLTLTASGTHAAETVRTSVESAVGVDLASIELPALPQAEPLPPPPAPPAPPETLLVERDGKATTRTRVIIRDKDGKLTNVTDTGPVPTAGRPRVMIIGKDGKIQTVDGSDPQVAVGMPHMTKRRIMFRDKDGKSVTWDATPDTPMPPEVAEKLKSMRVNMPEFSSRSCGEGEGKPGEHVINRKEGDKRVTIICTNRIERVASLAALEGQKAGAHAFVFQRRAEGAALDGLRAARRSIESNTSMGDTQRAAALSGIDQAIRDMEAKKD
jgi:beta-lactamase regulating signal transducer with metallopeptidase domain